MQLREDLGLFSQVETSNADHNTFVRSAQDLEAPFEKAFHCKKAFFVLGKDQSLHCDNAQMHCIPYVRDS